MAQFVKTFYQELNNKKRTIRHCEDVCFTGDNLSDMIGVYLTVDGQPYTGGGTVSGTVINSRGQTIPITTGAISGNLVTVTLEQGALAVPGLIGVYVKLTTGETVTTVLAAKFTVEQTETDTPIDPGTVISSVDALIARINTAVESIPADYSELLAGVAPSFSSSTAYTAGQYVWYPGLVDNVGALYRFTADHAAGSWTGTDAVSVSLAGDLGAQVTELKNAIVNSSDNITWYDGGINGTTGLETENVSRIKTGHLDRRITTVIPTSGWKVAIIAWKADGEFAGDWNGSAFVTTGLVFSTSAVDLTAINSAYSVRIVAGKTSDGNISASDGVNILLALDVNSLSEMADEASLKLSDMVDAHINLIQHLTPRSGYYYNGMTQTANSDYVAYPYLMLKAGVTYYYRNIYGAFTHYKDLVSNSVVDFASGWSGSITPTHDSILAATSTPTASATAVLTTSQDMYNASERKNIFYPTGLYVEKNFEANNLIPALSENMIEGANYFEGTWNNASSWTTDTAKYKGLTVKKRTGTWSGLNKGITVEAGKHYHFSAYYKVSSAASVQIALTQTGSTATVGFYDDNGVSFVQSLTIPSTVQRADVWRKVNIEFDCTSAGTIHPIIQAIASTTLYVCGYFVGEGYDTSKPFFTCKKSGSGTADFNMLYEAVVFASMFFDATVYVDSGEWDVVDEMGSTYMAAVDSSKRGLYLKNRIHLVFASDSSVVAEYEGEDDDTMLWFSPFNASLHGFTLENANIYAENVRYCVHDERNQDADQYTNRYINCKMKLDNSSNTGTDAHQCIGGGLGLNGHIIIQGGDYESINTAHIPSSGYTPISYHNSAGSGKSRIDISDVYIHSGSVRLNWYGTSPSTDKTECYVSGCSFTHAIISGPETQDTSPNQNIEVIAWNNEIRSN